MVKKILPNENIIQSQKALRCRRIVTGIASQTPIDDGCIIHNGKTILDIGRYKDLKVGYSGQIEDLGGITIVPGLINAHCHLSLSKLEGKTESGKGFFAWLLSMIANNYKQMDFDAIKIAAIKAKECGTYCFGDIVSVHEYDAEISRILTELEIYHICFDEFFGFSSDNSEYLRLFEMKAENKFGDIAGAGHALHTTNADILSKVKTLDKQNGLPFSIHMSEHEEEIGMLMGEKNSFYKLMEGNGFLDKDYFSPMKTPVEYGYDIGILDNTTIAVHCVHLNDNDLEILVKTGTNVCLCPRSNAFIGVGRAPWEKLLVSGICISIATDSIASNYDLNLWNELSYFINELEMDISLSEAIALITFNPAKALLMDGRIGSLQRGKILQYAIMPEEIMHCFKTE